MSKQNKKQINRAYYKGMFSSLKHNILLMLSQIEENIEYSNNVLPDLEFIELRIKEIKNKLPSKIGCGRMYCAVCGELDESHTTYCIKDGRSIHCICGSDGLCKECREKNKDALLTPKEYLKGGCGKEFGDDDWKLVCGLPFKVKGDVYVEYCDKCNSLKKEESKEKPIQFIKKDLFSLIDIAKEESNDNTH